MDNLAHSLVGLALAEAGLRRTTARGTATLLIGANLADIDVLVHVVGDGVDALAFRRGWTHGVLAMVVLPLALAAAMLWWDRVARRRGGPPLEEPSAANARWLLILSAIGVWSHPLLDLLNTYGVRLLMPFSDRWFYGDALFIVDPWVWVALGTGILIARRRRSRPVWARGERTRGHPDRPAQVAVALVTVYVLAMAIAARAGATLAERVARESNGSAPASRIMAGPRLVSPLSRYVVRDLGESYEMGVLRFWPAVGYMPSAVEPSGSRTEEARAAARTADGAKFLSWSRFPQFLIEPEGDSVRVQISDLRYPPQREGDWATVVVHIRR